MTGYLLDTNAALIALTEPSRLSSRVRKAILAGPNVCEDLNVTRRFVVYPGTERFPIARATEAVPLGAALAAVMQ